MSESLGTPPTNPYEDPTVTIGNDEEELVVRERVHGAQGQPRQGEPTSQQFPDAVEIPEGVWKSFTDRIHREDSLTPDQLGAIIGYDVSKPEQQRVVNAIFQGLRARGDIAAEPERDGVHKVVHQEGHGRVRYKSSEVMQRPSSEQADLPRRKRFAGKIGRALTQAQTQVSQFGSYISETVDKMPPRTDTGPIDPHTTDLKQSRPPQEGMHPGVIITQNRLDKPDYAAELNPYQARQARLAREEAARQARERRAAQAETASRQSTQSSTNASGPSTRPIANAPDGTRTSSTRRTPEQQQASDEERLEAIKNDPRYAALFDTDKLHQLHRDIQETVKPQFEQYMDEHGDDVYRTALAKLNARRMSQGEPSLSELPDDEQRVAAREQRQKFVRPVSDALTTRYVSEDAPKEVLWAITQARLRNEKVLDAQRASKQ